MNDAIVVTTAPSEVKEGTKSRMAKLSARSYNFIMKAVEKRKNKLNETYNERYNDVMTQYQRVVENNANTNYQHDKLVNAVESLKNIGVQLCTFNEIVNGSRVLNFAGNKIKAIKMPNISKICGILKERNNISRGYEEAMDYGRNGEYGVLNDLVGSINSDIFANASNTAQVNQTTQTESFIRPTEPVVTEAGGLTSPEKTSSNFDALFANQKTSDSTSVTKPVSVETPVVAPSVVPPVTPQVNFFGTSETVPSFVSNAQGQGENSKSEFEALKEEIENLKAENTALHGTIKKLEETVAVKNRAIDQLLTEQYGPKTTPQGPRL